MVDDLKPVLSIVMPVHNEEACLEWVIAETHASILSALPESVLMAIDDGSRDSTPEILDDLARRFPQVMVFHKKNGGHGDALLYGLRRAEGRYLFLMDSDGQTDPRDFWALWENRTATDFISGVRTPRCDPVHRLLIARVLRLAIRVGFGVRCRDANAPFKLFTKEFWEKASPWIPPETITPSLFLSIIAGRLGGGLTEVEIRHRTRGTGISTIRYGRLVRFCLRAFFQLLKLRRSLRRGSGQA
jgi:glycosyltransferase involved in cell wall biosynthesis